MGKSRAALVIVGVLFCALTGRAAVAATPPNILLLVADDIGAEATSLYGKLAGKSGTAPMPNLEKIAANGLVFENTWVNPMCSPTRATILTGLYGHHTGVLVAGDVLKRDTTTIWDYIKEKSPAKYDMAVFGKWHLGGNGGEIQHVRDMRVPNYRGFLGAQVTDYFNWTAWNGNDGSSENVATYATTALTDWAIDFIKKHEKDRPADPWFVYVPYNAAHAPNQAPPADLHKIDLGDLKPGARGNTVPVYKATIQAMDSEIGRLLKNVDLTKTVVLYMGDNGTPSNVKDEGAGVRGSKTSTWEGGSKVPLVIAGAGVTRKGREAALVDGVDLYATIAALAGIPGTHVNDGYSLVPLLTDAKASTGRQFGFTEFCSGNTGRLAIRNGRYKLHYDSGSGWDLFDLSKDQAETKNLFDKPEVAAVQKKLQDELNKIKAEAPKGCFR